MNTISLADKKIPPQNIEIEQSVLAGCFLYEEFRQDAAAYISPDDFYKQANRLVFETIQELMEQKEAVDLVTVTDILKNKGQMERVGGATYLASIIDVPVPSSIKHSADRLKKYAQKRSIIELCGKTINSLHECTLESLDEAVNDFQKHALNMGQSLLVPWKTKAEITRESIERYEGLNKGATAKAVPTGFPIMDNYLGGGFRGGKLVIIAARPGVGKTTLANNMMKNMCRAGYCCGYFSLEMDSAENDDRWIAADSNVNTMKLYSEPGPSQEEWKRIIETAQRQSDWHLLIDDTGGLKIGEIKRRARQMVKAGAEIIFIDQLSKIGGKRNLSTFERNSEHVEELAFLKKELRIPIVLLAQLNRDLEKRQHKKPMLADLKNTGQLEEDADIALLGYRPGLYEQELPVDPEPAEWEIAKNRQGATRNIEMMFRRSRVKFYEVEKNGGK